LRELKEEEEDEREQARVDREAENKEELAIWRDEKLKEKQRI
jgi:hypothetical protein